MTDLIYARDLDDTGSMHICSYGDDGAVEYTRTPQWQPIETAPKDGTRVILYVPPYGAMTGHNTFSNFGGRQSDYWSCHSSLNRDAQPTHWMPLPTPPE